MKQINVFQIGCGKMSKYIMKYVLDLGGKIVGAVDIDPKKIGTDIGKIMELDAQNVIIQNVEMLDSLLKETKPDIAIITTESYLNDIENVVRCCVVNGVNVITSAEECFYAESSNPTLFKELDILARAYNVTITGCGYQDIFWGNLITNIASSTHNITKIKGSSSYNVEDYGLALAKAHGAGLSLEEFAIEIAAADEIDEKTRQKLIDERKFNASYMWNAASWIADKMHLTPTKITQKCIPTTSEEEIHSDTLNMDIKKGYATGMSAITTLETKEGIIIEAECIGKVYGKDEFDKNEWTIYGEPDTTLVINKPDTVRLTCADIASRIPDVIASVPGFIPTCKMNEPTYKIKY